MRVDALFRSTSARLEVIDIGAEVRAAALALSKPEIGLLVVCDGRRNVGVVSKSDLVRHLTGFADAAAPIAPLMSRDVVSCRPDDDLHATWRTMVERRLQNIPVVGEDSEPVGVLDVRDALKALLEHETYQEQILAGYIAGVGYQ